MVIKRLINNNIIVTDDPGCPGKELLVMGAGIGFKKRPGDHVEESRVEKRYRLVDATMANSLAELIENVPCPPSTSSLPTSSCASSSRHTTSTPTAPCTSRSSTT